MNYMFTTKGDPMTTSTPVCCACHTPRDLADLLLVVDVAPPHAHRFVCRPSRPLPGAMRFCFRDGVGPWFAERIELAEWHAPLVARPIAVPPAPEPAPVVPVRPGRLVAAGVPDYDEMRWGAWRCKGAGVALASTAIPASRRTPLALAAVSDEAVPGR